MLLRFLSGDISAFQMLAWVVGIIVAITVHEFAHALVAYRCGDDTAKRQGRLSLDPLRHYDLIGTTMILVGGMGWGKPVPVDPRNMRNPRWDEVKVSFAGPASNLIVVTLILLIDRHFPPPWPPWVSLATMVVQVNLMLAFFNLIPIPPLDGSHILAGFLPRRQASKYWYTMGRYGFLILIGLVFLLPGVLHLLVWVPASLFMSLLNNIL
ncbi:MAG: site-2 protease family protein [Armatimonadota bacterium]